MPAGIALLNAATNTFKALFLKGGRSVQAAYTELAQENKVTGQTVTYQWMPLGVNVEEWKGSRLYEDSLILEYVLANRKWASTLKVPIDAFEDDTEGGLGMYNNQAQQMGVSAQLHPDQLLADLLAGGFATAGVDGVFFFSAAHINKAKTNDRSNLVSANQALDTAAFNEAIDLLSGMKAYNGDSLKVTKLGELVLYVPTALRSTAEDILKEQLTGGGTNPLHNRARIEVLDDLASATGWYLAVVGPAAPKPFVFQVRKKTVMQQDRSQEFDKDEFYWGTKARYAMGYLNFEMIVGSTGAGG